MIVNGSVTPNTVAKGRVEQVDSCESSGHVE